MTGNATYRGFLRQLNPPGSKSNQPQPLYPLSETQEVTLGRDPSCEIVLDSNQYGGVSRKHATIRPFGTTKAGDVPTWQVCDLNSANGTYVNGQRLLGCRRLQAGDRITLGINGPEFIFEYPLPNVSKSPSSYHPDSVTLTQLFPILSTGRDLKRKAYLVPAAIAIIFVVSMFASIGNSAAFNMLLAAYLSGIAYYFIYQLCGQRKPWWWLVTCAIITALILISPLLSGFVLVFRQILPGKIPGENEQISFALLLVRMFFGAGLMEELLKALPVLLAFVIGYFLRSPWRERLGVWEPLDGILLGTASAVGFTLLETLGQYVPDIIQNVTLQAGKDMAELVGLQLLIPRILGSVAGHMAYSGYLGYFIGLSVLKSRKRWLILTVGYLTAASLHALWNATGTVSFLLLAFVGILSYAFLAAAILKARALSPTRAQNFATRISGSF
ncbi:MAG: PrsW family glutamic-type intramembrane protease [Oscillatoriaceae bacterium SKW80]|nr:PrsW family glutamic-type intramembrane protease [Oscillatoriaceae bacterium SKW80]HIK29352.1 PrsW family intramembrane metalloprotease [Oscillatoriaceae cyanobacterium M7585_C2015_266]